MRNIKLTLEYDGTNYNGWQIQACPAESGVPGQKSIQGEIKKARQKILKEKITLFGSGRTDSGVHALAQVANFKTKSLWPLIKIQKALNANLPDDISIVKIEEVPLNFHAQFNAKSKVYRYTILNREAKPALLKNFCLFYRRKLNVVLMKKEAAVLVGRKDFKSFQATPPQEEKSKNKSTIRTIKRLGVKEKGDYIEIEVEGDGFLHKMVRNIVGTLLEIGSGQLPPGSVKKILKKKNRIWAGDTAKPKGLSLVEVKYWSVKNN